MIFWLHPVWQAVATLLGMYVLALGCQRVLNRHCGRKTIFAWQAHVRWGRGAIGLWMPGAILGLIVARMEWGAWLITGGHAWVGLAFIPAALFGYVSGRLMDKEKKRRTILPVVHGLVNCALIAAALWQAWSGWPFLP